MAFQKDAERIAALTEIETKTFEERTRGSQALLDRASLRLPLGVPSSFQASPPYPIYLERGQGAHVWDVDGNEYADYHNGFGAMIVGHAHPRIVQAISERAALGTHFAAPGEEMIFVADELAARFSQPKWRFANSGTEATLDAIHIARGFTGKDRIMKIEGSYHGHHDSVMVSVKDEADDLGPRDNPNATPQSGGIPDVFAKLTVPVPYNDPEALEATIRRYNGEVACLIMEPVMMNVGIIAPQEGYLDAVREICTRHGVVLIFDEVKTGLTMSAGGATEWYGVVPDLVCLAKAVGGGTPTAAIGGNDEIMGVVERDDVSQLGTFNGNALSMHVAHVALTEVLTPEAYDRLEGLNRRLLGGCQGVIDKYGLPMYTVGFRGKGCVIYADHVLVDYRDYIVHLDRDMSYLGWLFEVNRGIFMTPGYDEQWTLSVQHDEADVDAYVSAFETFGSAVAAAV